MTPSSVAVEGARAREPEAAAVPPVADRDREHRCVVDQVGDVVDAVAEAPLVRAPARAEHVIANGVTVQPRLEDTPAADRKPSPSDRPMIGLERELLAEQRRRGRARAPARSSARGPVDVHADSFRGRDGVWSSTTTVFSP